MCLDWSVPAVILSHMSLATGRVVPLHFRTRQFPWTTLVVAQEGLGAADHAGSLMPQVPSRHAGALLTSCPQIVPGSQPSGAWFMVQCFQLKDFTSQIRLLDI